MAFLTKEFDQALTAIEPDDDVKHAMMCRDEVVEALKEDDAEIGLVAWGLDPILIGSYKRHVSIKRIKDVDVFCRLRKLPDDVDPVDLLKHTESVLRDAFPATADGTDRVTLQGRSVQVSFPEWNLYVDAVPAREREDGTWEIPCKEPGEGWEQTDPDRLTTLSSLMNDAHDDFYVPTVKLMRQTRRALGVEKPGGLFVEMVTYAAFEEHPERGSASQLNSQAEYFVETLERAAEIVRRHVDDEDLVPNPALPGEPMRVRATDEQWVQLRDRLKAAAEDGRVAFTEADPCKAAEAYRELLGKDSTDEWVFPMPPDCNADGTRRYSLAISPGADRLPSGDSPRFA